MERSLTSTLAVAWAVAAATSAGAQSVPAPTVSLSTDTIQVGDLFELHVSLSVPPASVVYFPDTLAATVNVESAGPVRTSAEPSDDGGARLTLIYPAMAFGAGTLPVPGFDVLITPRTDQVGSRELPGGSVTGAWSAAPPGTGPNTLTRIPRQAVWVEPVFTPADFIEGIEPMPPSDVVGGAWNWPSLALVMLFSSVLAITVVSTIKDWLTRHEGAGGAHAEPTLEARRLRALRQLDDLLAERLHEGGRLLDFYTRSSSIVRSYVEAMDVEWAPSLTTGELMGRLQKRWGEEVASCLPAELGSAEVVKFGRLRPDARTAEQHWRTLRDWVEKSGARAW